MNFSCGCIELKTMGAIIQIIVAVLIVMILFVVGLLIYNAEQVKAIREAGKQRRSVTIFEGIKDLKSSKDETYNTLNTSSPTYRAISSSVNQPGGAEYSYNFWLYIDYSSDLIAPQPEGIEIKKDQGYVSTDGLNKDIVLFLHGDKTLYTYKNICSQNKTDVMIKSPMVKLQNYGDVLSVELNTLAHPDGMRETARNNCQESSTSWMAMNAHRLAIAGLRDRDPTNFDKKWFMVTVVVRDTNPGDDLPLRNKVEVRIYVNGILELERYVDGSLNKEGSVLRNNNSMFHFAPVIKNSANAPVTKELDAEKVVMMSDLTYFNYGVDMAEIKSLHKRGITKKMAPSVTDVAGDNNSFLNEMSNTASDDKKMFVGF